MSATLWGVPVEPLVRIRQWVSLHVVLAEQRHVGFGLGQAAGIVEVDRDPADPDRLLALGRRELAG